MRIREIRGYIFLVFITGSTVNYLNMMPPLADWLPPACVGVFFTLFACLKLYGVRRNTIGGGGKPWTQRCLGGCPSWSRGKNLSLFALLLGVGLANLAWTVSIFLRR